MGNRNGGQRIYSIPSFFTLRDIRNIYSKSNDDNKQIMNSIIPLKSNFYVRGLNNSTEIIVQPDDRMTFNSTSLRTILQADSRVDDIAVVQFQYHNQSLFTKSK